MGAAFAKINALARSGGMKGLATQMLSVAAALVIASGLMFGFNSITLRHDFDANRAASRTIERLNQIEVYLMGIEMTMRGYALSGNPDFLDYNGRETRKFQAAFAGLPALVADVPEHRKCLARLRSAIRVRLDTLSGLLHVAHSDPAAVGRAIADPSVRATMREARAAITSMRRMEIARRDAMTGEALRRTNRSTLLAGGVLALSFVFGVLGLSFALFGSHQRGPGTGLPPGNPAP